MRRTHTSSIFLQSPQRMVAHVLEELDRYREWLPGIERSRVLAREDRTSVLEIASRRWAKGRALFEVTIEPQGDLHFRQVGRLGNRGVSGSAKLEEADEGVMVEIQVVVPVSGILEAVLGGLFGGGRREIAATVAEAVHALDLRVQKAVLGALPMSSGRQRSLFEVRRQGDGYELRFQGKSWRLVEAEAEGRSDP